MSEQRATLFAGTAPAPHRLGRHAGKTVAEALRRLGTDTVFTLCGGHVLPILDGCLDAGIRVVDARHEAHAVMMASAWAQTTGRVGVAAITAGPGFTNAVTGIADANHSGIPVVVLGGRTPLRSWKRDAIQDIDQLAVARAICKRATLCLEAGRVEEYVADAFFHALTPRAGAVYVELPTDVLMATPPPPRDPSMPPPGHPDEVDLPVPAPSAARRLRHLLEEAERPVVVCGSGAVWSGAGAALRRFTEKTAVPVTTVGLARGLLPDSHPGSLGSLAHGGVAVAVADVVLLVGSRFDGNMLFGGPPLFSAHQRIVQIDVRAEAVGGNRVPDLAVVGDAGATLDRLADEWTGPPRSTWLEEARRYAEASRAAWVAEEDKATEGIHPGRLARTVEEVTLGRDRTLVCDGGDILTWGIAHFTAERPASILTTGTALGTLGVGVPFAVGAKAARPRDLVVALVGDGAFGLCAMELDTSARLSLPVVVVVSNNGAWGDVQHEQEAWFGEDRLVASTLGRPRYEKLAEMVGGFGVAVKQPGELRGALEAAIASGAPALVNVRTDPSVVSEILRGIGQLGVM